MTSGETVTAQKCALASSNSIEVRDHLRVRTRDDRVVSAGLRFDHANKVGTAAVSEMPLQLLERRRVIKRHIRA